MFNTFKQNTEAFKDKILAKNETLFAADKGTQENPFNLPPDVLKKRKIVYIDIVNDPISPKDYKESEDPTKFVSKKTGRGPLGSNWKNTMQPITCVYKLIYLHAKYFGLQRKLEKKSHEIHQKVFTLTNRRIFCWMDEWYGMTQKDVRRINDQLKTELTQVK